MIFASRYKLHLPTEAELREEIRKEIRALEPPEAGVRKSKSTSVGTTKTKKKKV
jgi:hypothetical protein